MDQRLALGRRKTRGRQQVFIELEHVCAVQRPGRMLYLDVTQAAAETGVEAPERSQEVVAFREYFRRVLLANLDLDFRIGGSYSHDAISLARISDGRCVPAK